MPVEALTATNNQVSQWTDALSRVCGCYETTMPDDVGFLGEVDIGRTEDVEWSRIRTNAHQVVKSQVDTGREVELHYCAVLQHRGQTAFEQKGKSALLSEGDIFLMDRRYSCRFQMKGSVEHVSIKLPIGMIKDFWSRDTLPVAEKISSQYGAGAVLRSYLSQIIQGSRQDGSVLKMDTDLGVFMRILGATVSDASIKLSASDLNRVMLNSIKLYLERNLFNHELNFDQVAREHHISRAKLFRLFRGQNLTPYEWVKEARLSRSRDVLVDDRYREASIAKVAFDCGFSGVSYFTREFSAKFGLPPDRFRKLRS